MGFPSTRDALCLLVASLSIATATAAHADRVAAMPPRLTGADTAGLQDGFRSSLAGGLAAAGHDVIAASELDRALAEQPALAACATDVCLAQLGEHLGVREILRGAIEVIGSSNYNFRLELYDVTAGRVTEALDDACTICTVREANEALSRAAASLGKKIAPAVEATKAAPSAPVAASTRSMHTPSTARSHMFLGLGAGALVLGLGAVGAGAALIAIDGPTGIRGGTSPGDPLMQDVRHTQIAGIVLTAAGGVVLAGAGVLFWRAHVNRHAAP